MRNLIWSALLFLFSAFLLIFYDAESEKKDKTITPGKTASTTTGALKSSQNLAVTANR